MSDLSGLGTNWGTALGKAYSGTSNPGSPSSGDLFFRTDLGLLIYYDGTRWLTVNEYTLPLHNANALEPMTATNGSGNSVGVPDLTQGGMWVTRLSITTLVLTTTNSTNYWTIQFQSAAPSGTKHSIGSSFDTKTDTADQYQKHTVTVGAQVTAGDVLFHHTLTKTLSPGNLYVITVAYYRLIVT